MRRTLGAAGLSVLSAVLLIVIWPSFGNLWWLTFVALVPMYVAQYRLVPRRWSGVPVAVAFGGYNFALFLQGTSVLSMGPILALTAGAALIGLLIGIFQRPFAERTGYRWFVLQLPLIWVSIDLLIQNNEILGTYSWIAYRLAEAPHLVQPVSITGTPALSLLIHVINATAALVVIALIDRRFPGLADVPVPARVLRWSVAIPVAATAIWVIASLVIFRDVSNRMGPQVRVAAVQPGLDNAIPGTLISAKPMPGRTEDQRNTDQIAQLSAMTRDAASQGAKVVVWPEEVLNYDPRVTRTDWIPALVRETGVYLAMGFTPNGDDPTAPNTSLLWSPQGEVKAVYYKVERVIVEGEAFTPGTVFPSVETSQGVLGMIICFDIDFPDGPARRVTQSGAQMILAPSIDFRSIADLRSASTAFRAVENRVAMVKADVAWDSVIAAPNGEVITSTAMQTERGDKALLVADVPLGPRGAPFTRFGGAPFQWLVYAATVVMLGAMVGSKRARRETPVGSAAVDR
ncbi:MAG: nitrilase-related carbon-nitrogen hydrolase [Mycobacterium sp.]